MANDSDLREHLIYLLSGGGAHLGFYDAFGGIPTALRGCRPAGLPYTPWRLLEHIRIAQADILDFCRNPGYEERPFPEGYWPRGDAPEKESDWDESVQGLNRDLQAIIALVRDPATDLFAKIPWGDGQTILREALLAADHNSYHLGEMVAVRTALGIVPAGY